MRVAVSLALAAILLAGCNAGRAAEPSGYCDGLAQVESVLRDWPLSSMTDHQATTTLAKAYIMLAEAAANDFGGQAQLDVTAFSDDVGRLKNAIEDAVGVDTAIAAIRQAIPSLPSCAGSPSP